MTETERSFEELYRDLEGIVRQLEAGDLPLAESMTLFERATSLAEKCNALLDHADLRVRQLTVGADGALETTQLGNWQGG
jgi:exodeoxyribonuclease VII small subunit